MPPAPTNAILTIAGSDPSGGAGIQADLKTFTAAGVYGAAAITCLTAQNTLGVQAIQPVAPEFVKQQVELVLADLPVSHIKTGMIGTATIAGILGEILSDFSGEVICDPVLRASDGAQLMEDAGLDEFRRHLLGNATVITPNLPELARLSGLETPDQPALQPAVTSLFEGLPRLRAVIVTGGHLNETSDRVTDFLFLRRPTGGPSRQTAHHPRFAGHGIHGTGCTLAAAFAAFHLRTGDYTQAFNLATGFMAKLLELSVKNTMGHGDKPLLHHLMTMKPLG